MGNLNNSKNFLAPQSEKLCRTLKNTFSSPVSLSKLSASKIWSTSSNSSSRRRVPMSHPTSATSSRSLSRTSSAANAPHAEPLPLLNRTPSTANSAMPSPNTRPPLKPSFNKTVSRSSTLSSNTFSQRTAMERPKPSSSRWLVTTTDTSPRTPRVTTSRASSKTPSSTTTRPTRSSSHPATPSASVLPSTSPSSTTKS